MDSISNMNFDNIDNYYNEAKNQFNTFDSNLDYLQQKIDSFLNLQKYYVNYHEPSSQILENNSGLVWFVLE